MTLRSLASRKHWELNAERWSDSASVRGFGFSRCYSFRVQDAAVFLGSVIRRHGSSAETVGMRGASTFDALAHFTFDLGASRSWRTFLPYLFLSFHYHHGRRDTPSLIPRSSESGAAV